jgi:hypothetical protein
MTHYSIRHMGTPGHPDDPPELTEAADLHIMLIPSDQPCVPAREKGSVRNMWGRLVRMTLRSSQKRRTST